MSFRAGAAIRSPESMLTSKWIAGSSPAMTKPLEGSLLTLTGILELKRIIPEWEIIAKIGRVVMKELFLRWIPLEAIKNISIITIGKFFSYGAGFLYVVFAARILGSDGYGRLVQIMAIVYLFSLPFKFNLSAAAVKLFKERLAGDREERIKELAQSTAFGQVVGSAGFSLVFFIFLIFGAVYWPRFEAWQTALGLFALSEVLHLVRLPFTSILEAYEKFGWRTATAVYTSLWRDFFTVIMMIWGGVLGACLGYLIGEIFIALFIFVISFINWGRETCKLFTISFNPLKDTLYVLYRNARSNYVADVLKRGYKELQKIILGEFVGDAGVGLYSIALKFQKFFQFMASPVGIYLYPRLVEKWNRLREEFYYTLRKYFYQMGAANVALAVVLGLLTPWLVPLLFSSEYLPSIPLVWIMLPAFAVSQLFSIFRRMTFVISQQRALLFESSIKFIVGLPATVFLVSQLDYTGAAWAHAITFYAVVLYQVYFFYKHFKWRWIVPAD